MLISFTPNGVTNLIDFTHYFSFLMRMLLVFGIAMEIPLFVLLLNLAGVVSGQQIGRHRPWIIVGTMVFAAVATPSTDPFSMLMLGDPDADPLRDLRGRSPGILDRIRGGARTAPTAPTSGRTTRPRRCDLGPHEPPSYDEVRPVRPARLAGGGRGHAGAPTAASRPATGSPARLSAPGADPLGCDLLAIDDAYPAPVASDALRVRAHQVWQYGEVLLVPDGDRLVLAVPGSRLGGGHRAHGRRPPRPGRRRRLGLVRRTPPGRLGRPLTPPAGSWVCGLGPIGMLSVLELRFGTNRRVPAPGSLRACRHARSRC